MKITEENIDFLFSEKKKEIEQIETCKVYPFKGHPYKVNDDDEMQELICSIKEYGILEPVKVRKDDFSYEVISGHRRLHAAMKLGLQTLPAIVYEISRDEAAVMVVDSNLHREHILPSEKAFSYKLKYEALKHQGKRTDLTSEQIAPKLTTELIAEQDGTSKDTVKRYIRLTNLISELLDLMDKNKIAFSVGVELSYLDEDKQYTVLGLIEELDCTPSYAQANHMHKDFIAGILTDNSIEEMLSADKSNQIPTYKIPQESFEKYLSKFRSNDERTAYLLKACECYERELKRKRDRGAR